MIEEVPSKRVFARMTDEELVGGEYVKRYHILVRGDCEIKAHREMRRRAKQRGYESVYQWLCHVQRGKDYRIDPEGWAELQARRLEAAKEAARETSRIIKALEGMCGCRITRKRT